jgi:molybdenum cofactor synthesis domain-containing protein
MNAHSSRLLTLTEARERLEANVRPIERTETVTLESAGDRVAAADVRSTVSVPPFARSAMDGYAVVSADTTGASPTAPAKLQIVERIYSGQVPQRSLLRGTCAQIATGAPLPSGADAVVMVELTAPEAEDQVHVFTPVSPGQNIGHLGSDISPGDVVVRRGDWLSPSKIGAIAALGRPDVEVYGRPRVAVLPSGDEVVDSGKPLKAGQIYDVNRFTLAAVINLHGGTAELHRPVADTLDAQLQALDACGDADIIVFSGGSSVGERDLVPQLVEARGRMIFHGIAVKPGKPTAFAIVGDKPFFGMPGNPTSCLSNAYVLLVPFLRAIARLPPFTPRTTALPLSRRIVSPAGRHQFYTVRIQDGVAVPAFKGSGEITSLSQADGYIEIPANQSTVEEGTFVDVIFF